MSGTTVTPQIVMDGDRARAGKNHPLASHAAADRSAENKRRIEDAVLELVFTLSSAPDGNTVNREYESRQKKNDWPDAHWDTPRKRLTDLVRDGYVARLDKGTRGGVYVLTIAGFNRHGAAVPDDHDESVNSGAVATTRNTILARRIRSYAAVLDAAEKVVAS